MGRKIIDKTERIKDMELEKEMYLRNDEVNFWLIRIGLIMARLQNIIIICIYYNLRKCKALRNFKLRESSLPKCLVGCNYMYTW